MRGELALLALLATCCAPQPQPQDQVLQAVKAPEDLGRRAFEHLSTIVGFGERHPGSPGWRKSLEYFAKELAECGLEVERDRWHDAKENVDFENVIGRIRGASDERILIAAHHDTKRCAGHADPARNFYFVGANDSGSGTSLMLALARDLAKGKHRATLEFVFLDGEESMTWEWNDGVRALFGSKRFVAKEQEVVAGKRRPPIKALVLLDMVGAADLQIDDDSNSDVELRQIIGAAAKACGHERYFFAQKQAVKDDHLPFVAAGIKSVDLVDIADNPQWHTKDDTLAHVSAKSLQIVGEVVLTALPEIERRFVRGEGAKSQPSGTPR